ncbi:MAG: peptide ABC transporter substrate-binding protein [Pseudomonadota bacterium]|jgi:oligopeptide transport system substrate-binding protein|uniref:Oligopeptide ABC transporter, periplasmic oligopeptide-binding protein OppA n=1 Tax=Caballeronia sordidicola TaxID=196367 RepID=A0A242N8G6_CABSO|nr:peptide ABC transporter substrate-binding protein [Caballeronia sordidicola]MDP9153533.1 peptide ABC transporter substrate-binding protein [Pseudomonadota bacterium]OTP79947.1 Oligopeptide ABC transporter, periplasmic oligopeptide-binding protein OppA [Caballeronia sordidicola]
MFFASSVSSSVLPARRSSTLLAACLFSAAILPSLASAAIIPPGTQLAAKQELVRNNGSEVETLDPNVAESVPANNVTRDLFEGLTAVRSDGETVPGVAEKWEMKDSTTWIFHLRKNAKWSNGETVTAGDFVFSAQRLVDPKTASPYANTYGMFLLNGTEIVAGKKPVASLGVTAIDANTLQIRTPYPVPFLPDLMTNTNFGPINKAAMEKNGKDWTKPGKLVSNGAFMLKDWQVNNRLVLAKNPNYWNAGYVQLNQVTYLPIEDENTDVKQYESGGNDWVYQLPSGTFARYKQEYPNEMRAAPMLGLRYYSFNNKDPLLKDVRVRKALSMVIDRDILAQRVTADGQIPAYGVIVKGVKGADVNAYDWASWPMAKRVEEAKKLLAEAGVKPGTKLQFAMNTSEYHKKMAIFAASEWKSKLGLDTDIQAMEFKVLLKKRHDGDYQIARNGWVADYNDASTFLTLVQCGSEQNDNQACNPKADALMREASNSTDPATRLKLQTEAGKVAMEDYPMLPLLQYTLVRLVKSYVGGYSTKNPMDHYRSEDLYIIKH